MAATNPHRVSDLIKKYGWEFIPYASALGPDLAEAQVLFVDCNHGDALDSDDGRHGHSFELPLATVDYAIGLCTASERSVILVAPGHYEDFDDTTTGFDADIAGVVIVGLGTGSLVPRFDFNDATSMCILGANDVVLRNFVFRPSVATVAIGIDIESGVTGCILEDITFAMGEEGDETDEFVKAIHLTSGNHDTVFRNVKILAHASCDGATHGIHVDAASDRLTFDNVVIHGPYTNGISEDAAGKNHIVVNCSVDVDTTNYGFDGSSTYAKWAGNVDAGISEDEADPLTDVAAGDGVYPTGITNDSIIAKILSKSATAAASSYDNTEHSLEAIGDKIDLIDVATTLTTAVPAEPTARSLQDIMEKDATEDFDRATDSLEAISDSITEGTTFGAGINLDHLNKTDTGVAADADLTTYVADGSILSHIMTKGADTSDYQASSHSLEALADAIAAVDTSTNLTTAVPTEPTARSLQDIMEKDSSGHFDDATDSLEAIADRQIDAKLTYLAGVIDGGTHVYPDSVAEKSMLAYLMTSDGDITGYNYTTDSLEAISEALAAGTGCTTAIEADKLDHLVVAADSDDPANDSIIAKIAASDGDWSGFDKTTDSLEAISDSITAGTTFGAGINLDHLNKTTTTVAADSDLTTYVADGSILSHIMTKAANTDTYRASTDSLEAIADTLLSGTTLGAGINLDHLNKTDTTVSADGDLTTYVADGSILSHIMTVGANTDTYKASTDSLEAISNILTAGTGLGAGINLDHLNYADTTVAADEDLTTYVADGSILSHIMTVGADTDSYNASTDSLEAIGTDTDDILVDTDWVERTVKKTGAVADTDDLFTVADGPILIKSLIGVVTTQIGASQTRIAIWCDSASTNDDRYFSTSVDLTGDAVGTIYVFSAANPAVLTPLATGANGGGNPQYPWYCPAGVIEQDNSDDTETGAIDWYLTYVPLASGVTVTEA